MQRFTGKFRPVAWWAALVIGLPVAGPALAGHPFVSDDTGTQGAGHWQFEVSTDHTRVKEAGAIGREQSVDGTLTYGLTDTLDLGLSLPYRLRKPVGETSQKGFGDVALQAKWRFYEHSSGWSLALKPALTLPSGSESKGLGAGRSTASLNLLGQYEQDGWGWLVNAGVTHNDNKAGERKRLWNASTAVLYSPDDRWTFGADVGLSRNPDPVAGSKHRSYALLGVQYHIDKNTDVDIGYRRSLQSGPREHTVGVGLTVRW